MKSFKHSKLLATISRYPQVIAWGPVVHSQGYLVPYYFNFRAAPSLPKLRQAVVDALVKVVKKLKVDIVAGAETAGMAWAALVAERLNLPYVYVRKERKKSLDLRAVEGIFKRGSKAVLIDDTMLRGETKQKMIMQARRDGLCITDLVIIYYAEPNEKNKKTLAKWFKKYGVRKIYWLVTKKELVRAFVRAKVLTVELKRLNDLYMTNPYGWNKTVYGKRLLPLLNKQHHKYERA